MAGSGMAGWLAGVDPALMQFAPIFAGKTPPVPCLSTASVAIASRVV